MIKDLFKNVADFEQNYSMEPSSEEDLKVKWQSIHNKRNHTAVFPFLSCLIRSQLHHMEPVARLWIQVSCSPKLATDILSSLLPIFSSALVNALFSHSSALSGEHLAAAKIELVCLVSLVSAIRHAVHSLAIIVECDSPDWKLHLQY